MLGFGVLNCIHCIFSYLSSVAYGHVYVLHAYCCLYLYMQSDSNGLGSVPLVLLCHDVGTSYEVGKGGATDDEVCVCVCVCACV